MAAQAFPLPITLFADKLRIATVDFMIRDNDIFSGLGSGELIASQLAARVWRARVSSARYTHQEAKQLQATIEMLDGSMQTFYLWNPLAPYPQSDPTGSIYGASTPTIHTIEANRKEIRVTGLPATYALTLGDMFHVDYGNPTRRGLYRVTKSATAVAGLTPLFEIRPHLRTGITTTLNVNFIKPAGKFKMVPGTLEIQMADLKSSTITFEAIQTLQAG